MSTEAENLFVANLVEMMANNPAQVARDLAHYLLEDKGNELLVDLFFATTDRIPDRVVASECIKKLMSDLAGDRQLWDRSAEKILENLDRLPTAILATEDSSYVLVNAYVGSALESKASDAFFKHCTKISDKDEAEEYLDFVEYSFAENTPIDIKIKEARARLSAEEMQATLNPPVSPVTPKQLTPAHVAQLQAALK